MEEQIIFLFSQALSPQTSDEDRAMATQTILQLYENPESFLALFSIIKNKENSLGLRQMAAVSLRKCLNGFWENVDANSREVIKQNILNMISAESELLIAKNIIESCETVFETDTRNWPNLINFISSDLNNPIGLLIKLYLIYNIALYLKTDLIEANFDLFQAIASQGINSQDQEAILLTCQMLGAIISFISPEKIAICQPQEEYLIQVFYNYLSMPPGPNYDVTVERIVFALADTFLGDALPIPPVAILQQLLQVIQNPQFPKEKYIHVFTLLQYLIKGHADDLIDEAEPILRTIILCGAASFDPNDYESIYDVNYIASTAGDFAGELQMPRFLKLVQSLAPKEPNDALFISFAHVLYNSIDECSEEMENDIKPIVETTIQFLNSQNIYIKEVGAQIAVIIGDSLEPSQLDLAVVLIQNLIQFVVSGIPSLTTAAFSAITNILNQGLIRNDLVPEILNIFLSVLQNDTLIDFHYLSLEAISALIYAVEEDILPYSAQILPIIIKAATLQTGNPTFDLLKQQAITALGMILRFGSSSIQNSIQQAVELIISSADPDDIEMSHAVLFALGNLIIARFPILVNYRERIINIIDGVIVYLINHVLSSDEENENQERERTEFSCAIRGFTDTLNIMKWIFKNYNELSPESPTQWMVTILQFMVAPYPELQTRSIVAGMYGTAMIMRLHPVDQPQYFEVLVSLFNSDEPTVVGACFKAFNFLFKENIPLVINYYDPAVHAAFCALEGTLPFQKIKNKRFDFHSSKHLFRFFKTLYRINPENFPLQKFISSGQKMLNSSRQLFEMAQYIKVINLLYAQCHATLKSLSKKVLVKNMIECFNRFAQTFSDEDIDYSAFSVPPSPLASIFLLLQYDPNLVSDAYRQALPLIEIILNHEFNGERFYNATIATAIEFLCINYQITPDSFDLTNWLPLILRKLPLNRMGCEKYSEHIYTVILGLMANEQFVQNYGQEVLRIFAQTLGVKDRLFKMFQFTQATLNNIIVTTKQLIDTFQASPESLKSFFTDEQTYMRFMARISS